MPRTASGDTRASGVPLESDIARVRPRDGCFASEIVM